MNVEQLLELSNSVVEQGMQKDVHAVEVYFQRVKTMQITVSGQDVSNERATSELGFGIRVLRGESEGFAYTNKFDEESLKRCLDDAIKMANVIPPKAGASFALPSNYPHIEGLYSSKISNITAEDLVSYVDQIVTPFKEAPVELRTDLSRVQVIEESVGIVNSLGVEGSYQSNYLDGSFFLIARDGDKVGSFVTDNFFTRDPSKVNFTQFGSDLADRAIRNLNAVKAPKIDSDTVIFKPDAVLSPIFIVVANSISAEEVQKNRSFWKDRLADKVAVENLSISDSPHDVTGGEGVRPFDDEGTPTKETTIIKDGILENFLFDVLRAHRAHTISSGNSWRSMQGSRFTNGPSIILPNAPIIHPGDHSNEELIEETKLGIIFEYFSGSYRPENGIFSGVAKGAQLIENGEITKPLINVSIAGNVFDALNNIEGISNTVALTSNYLRTPWLKITGIKISTQE